MDLKTSNKPNTELLSQSKLPLESLVTLPKGRPEDVTPFCSSSVGSFILLGKVCSSGCTLLGCFYILGGLEN